MKHVFFIFMTSFLTCTWAHSQTIEDEILIEAEAAMADSDAAQEEAKEAEKIAAAEYKQSQAVVRKAEREIERARRLEAQSKRRIGRAEKKRAMARKAIEKAKQQMESAKTRIEVTKDEIEETRSQIDEVNSQRTVAMEQRDVVLESYTVVQNNLKKMKLKLAKVKKEELGTIKELKRAENRLKSLQEKSVISYKNADKEMNVFLKGIKEHRDSLAKIAKRLDQLEIEVETDKTFYDKQTRQKLTRNLGKVIRFSNTKVAKVISSDCNVRNYPSVSSKVVAHSNRGRKVKIRKHNSQWYSVIHHGQKAFMGVNCFRN